MRVHNLVKDLVVQKVDELFADAEGLQALALDKDPGSKYDVICYVLNRTPPPIRGFGARHRPQRDGRLPAESSAAGRYHPACQGRHGIGGTPPPRAR